MRKIHVAIAVIVLLSMFVTAMASRRNSTTFDEITVIAGGARGWRTGSFNAMENYPPVTQYLYGLPVYLSKPNFPQEMRTDTVPPRYLYAQIFMFRSGNDPEVLAFRARLLAAACAGALALLAFLFTARHVSPGAGLLAGTLVAFLPDLLAHGGVAYNDVPLALAFFASVWLIDATLRAPTMAKAIGAGIMVSIAVGTKYSALVLGPIAVVLLLLEIARRAASRDLRAWLPAIGLRVLVAIVVAYLVQVALYQGDFALTFLRQGVVGAQGHITGGHGVPTYLLGRMYADAPWYTYPVQFLYKTPMALHILMVLALIGLAISAGRWSWRDVLASPMRAPVVAIALFLFFLLRANLTIGFRYALPVLPLVCVLTSAGVALLWQRVSPIVRGAIVFVVVFYVASPLTYYPHFLAYTSEYQSDPELGYFTFVDSSLDWGQGLIELRDFMRRENIPSVYLSYFGSALPEGYGIRYVPLASFFPLPKQPPLEQEPKFIAVSATNLVGLYFAGDPFAGLRKSPPYKVLGHTIFVYRIAP